MMPGVRKNPFLCCWGAQLQDPRARYLLGDEASSSFPTHPSTKKFRSFPGFLPPFPEARPWRTPRAAPKHPHRESPLFFELFDVDIVKNGVGGRFEGGGGGAGRK